jgi:hypothetical protein
MLAIFCGNGRSALIQEPWLYVGQIRSLNNSGGKIFSVAPDRNAFMLGAILMPYLC